MKTTSRTKPTSRASAKPPPKSRTSTATKSRRPAATKTKTKTVVKFKTVDVRGRYDAALTDAENRRHWQLADGLSAIAANSRGVRTTLRNRSRYETANNSYARGIINTKANHVVGKGPRLQVETGAGPEVDEIIETEFLKWSRAITLASKLRTMQIAKLQDGEAFAVQITNPRVGHAVKLDLRLFEAEHVTAPIGTPIDSPDHVDGIDFDEHGNPIAYHVLRRHPGGVANVEELWLFDVYEAAKVFHWFRKDRPEQARGVPEIMPALPLFANMRRFTLSVVAAAETAADFTAVLQTDLPADDETTVDPMEEVEINRRMMTTLPAGWKLGQFHAEQPVTGYKEFKGEVLNEIARCLDMPFNLAACNSSGYNYSSGRLDHQTYYLSVQLEQNDCEIEILYRLLAAWVDEAALAGVIPPVTTDFSAWSIAWYWDGVIEADSEKEANADAQELANGTATLAAICSRRGTDWRKVMRQRAKELQYQQQLEAEYGVKFPSAAPPIASSTNGPPQGGTADEPASTQQAA